MSSRSNGAAIATQRNERAGRRPANGHISNAHQDADVRQMVSAEIDKRAAVLHEMIAEAAYFRAKKRDFEPGHELEDWLAAEAEVVRSRRIAAPG